jgi:hypothetical protein
LSPYLSSDQLSILFIYHLHRQTCQLLVGSGWSPIFARAHLALGFVGDFYILSLLFVCRAVLASLYTALFYVHLCGLSAQFKREEKQRLEEAKLHRDFLKIKGMWTVPIKVFNPAF